MMFLEQFLEVALLVRIGHPHDFDFIETRRSGVGDRRRAVSSRRVSGCKAGA